MTTPSPILAFLSMMAFDVATAPDSDMRKALPTFPRFRLVVIGAHQDNILRDVSESMTERIPMMLCSIEAFNDAPIANQGTINMVDRTMLAGRKRMRVDRLRAR
jgi:hypothetical protein